MLYGKNLRQVKDKVITIQNLKNSNKWWSFPSSILEISGEYGLRGRSRKC